MDRRGGADLRNRGVRTCLAIGVFVASGGIAQIGAQTNYELDQAEREHICAEATAKPLSEPSLASQ